MKVLLLADINSSHTQKWVEGLRGAGEEIFLFSLSPVDASLKEIYRLVDYRAPFRSYANPHAPAVAKSRYLFSWRALQRYLKRVKPDLLHAHYASSYGLLGALTGFHPFLISAWGSDILDFPRKSYLNRQLLRYILGKADTITSPSHFLQRQLLFYTHASVDVIPFGVPETFSSQSPATSPFQPGDIILGVVKSMLDIYGIDLAIRALHTLVTEHPRLPLRLLLVGGGPQLEDYRTLASRLRIADRIHFTGAVPYSEAGRYHAMIDIFINLSRQESFGVSVLESAMLGKPAVVSKVGGLPELVEDEVTGFVVAPEDPESAAAAILKLATAPDLRRRMGSQARQQALSRFTFEQSVTLMQALYRKLRAQ